MHCYFRESFIRKMNLIDFHISTLPAKPSTHYFSASANAFSPINCQRLIRYCNHRYYNFQRSFETTETIPETTTYAIIAIYQLPETTSCEGLATDRMHLGPNDHIELSGFLRNTYT